MFTHLKFLIPAVAITCTASFDAYGSTASDVLALQKDGLSVTEEFNTITSSITDEASANAAAAKLGECLDKQIALQVREIKLRVAIQTEGVQPEFSAEEKQQMLDTKKKVKDAVDIQRKEAARLRVNHLVTPALLEELNAYSGKYAQALKANGILIQEPPVEQQPDKSADQHAVQEEVPSDQPDQSADKDADEPADKDADKDADQSADKVAVVQTAASSQEGEQPSDQAVLENKPPVDVPAVRVETPQQATE